MPRMKNIVELRRLLTERLPNLKGLSGETPVTARSTWPLGVEQIDSLLHGGLTKGAITEIVGEPGSGGALLISSILRRAAETNQLIALIDGQDSFDMAGLAPEHLSRLLWVRCKDAGEALKAADFILRDRNLPLVILDLQINPASQLRKIPSATWYRLQRIAEQTSTVFTVFTPQPMVSGTQARLTLHGRFGLETLQTPEAELVAKLKVELAVHRLRIAPDRVAEAG